MDNVEKNVGIKDSQNENFESFAFKEIIGQKYPLSWLLLIYDRVFHKFNTTADILRQRVVDGLEERGLDEYNITGTKMKKSVIYVYLDTGESIKISLESLKKDEINNILGTTTKEKTEKNVAKLQKAIEQIYLDNEGFIWDNDINDNDTIDVEGFGKNLTLSELKKLLDIESKKLKKIYQITGETEKYKDLFKKEIQFYVGVGDEYEGGARYFGLSQREIDDKVRELSMSMSISELIEYIIYNNEQIDRNGKRSDMVNQTNKKLMNSLYEITFNRLRREDASNKHFIDFAKALTGRGKLKPETIYNKRNKTLTKDKSDFDYEDIDIDDDYKDIDMANKVLIFVMYKKGGLLDIIKEKKVSWFSVEDKEVCYRKPSKVVSEGLNEIGKLRPQDPNYAINVFNQAGFSSLLNIDKKYSELTFDEKVILGAIARITKIIKKSSPEEIRDVNLLFQKIQNTVNSSFQELNDSFSDNFDGFGGFFGKSADDLGLNGDFAEIFNLYQDINGNNGLFDFSDRFKDGLMGPSTAIVLGVSIIAGCIVFGPVLGALSTGTAISSGIFAGSEVTLGTLFSSGAVLGTVAGTTNILVQSKGYDTTGEALLDSSLQIGADALFSGLFTMVGVPIVTKLGNPDPDLLFSIPAWFTSAGLADKGFIVGEAFTTGVFLSPVISQFVRDSYLENHYDTNTYRYINGKTVKRLDK